MDEGAIDFYRKRLAAAYEEERAEFDQLNQLVYSDPRCPDIEKRLEWLRLDTDANRGALVTAPRPSIFHHPPPPPPPLTLPIPSTVLSHLTTRTTSAQLADPELVPMVDAFKAMASTYTHIHNRRWT
ncbi:hypothetical protein FBU30_005305 [Linnemannia zychae]|nr:hypothetical protein FBU30_005305 [Linnemannia zychae]